MPLRRTESYLTLPTVASAALSVSLITTNPAVPYQQSLQYYKDQRQRHKAVTRAALNLEPITIRTRLERTYSQPSLPRSRPLSRTPTLLDVNSFADQKSSFRIPVTCRASSPLSPKRRLLPGRPVFPRSKPEPDLYRLAIKTCMRYSPQGQKILQMGPRLALSILTATQDLERMVAEQESQDALILDDLTMDSEDDVPSSWMDMQDDDWEMSDGDDDDDSD